MEHVHLLPSCTYKDTIKNDGQVVLFITRKTARPSHGKRVYLKILTFCKNFSSRYIEGALSIGGIGMSQQRFVFEISLTLFSLLGQFLR